MCGCRVSLRNPFTSQLNGAHGRSGFHPVRRQLSECARKHEEFQDLEHTFVHFHGCFRSNNNHRDADAENRETDLAVWRVRVREWICALLGISPSLSDCLISPCVCACGDGPCWERLAMHICVTAAQESVWRSDDTRQALCWQASGTYSLCFSTI